MNEIEYAADRKSWDERNLGVATAPKPSAGFRLTETVEPPDAEAVAAYRAAVLKLARSGKEGSVDDELCTAAGRRKRDLDCDLRTARRRFAWAEQLRTLPKQIKQAEAADTAEPEPRGAKLSDIVDVAGLLKALEDFRAAKSAWECRPRGGAASRLQHQLGTAQQGLRDTADPAIGREIAALQEQRVNAQRRHAHWQPFVDEAGELQAVKLKLDQLSQGVLAAGERTRGPRSWWEHLIPSIKSKLDAVDARADQQKVGDLYDAAKARLVYLQNRSDLHNKAVAEVAAAEKELGTIGDEITRSRAEQLKPENMNWAI